MLLFLIYVLVILCIVAHEAGHFYAMEKNGVTVKEAGIGWPIPGLPYFSFRWRRFPETKFCIQLCLLGAYVMPKSERKMQRLSYRQQAEILGSGVWANFVFGVVVSSAAVGLTPDINYYKLAAATIVVVAIALLTRKLFCWLLPVWSLGVVVLFAYLFTRLGGDGGVGLVGPVGIVVMATTYTNSLSDALFYCTNITLSLGLFNLLPIPPLDGGQMIALLLRWHQRAQLGFQITGMVLMVIFIGYVMINDIWSLFQ